jgi:hypothetical protein
MEKKQLFNKLKEAIQTMVSAAIIEKNMVENPETLKPRVFLSTDYNKEPDDAHIPEPVFFKFDVFASSENHPTVKSEGTGKWKGGKVEITFSLSVGLTSHYGLKSQHQTA